MTRDDHGSPPLRLHRTDWRKISKGAAVAVIGALVPFTLTVAVPEMNHSGAPWIVTLAVALQILANGARKFLIDTRPRP